MRDRTRMVKPRSAQSLTSPRQLSAPLDLSFHLQPHLDVSHLTDTPHWPRTRCRRRPQRRPPPRTAVHDDLTPALVHPVLAMMRVVTLLTLAPFLVHISHHAAGISPESAAAVATPPSNSSTPGAAATRRIAVVANVAWTPSLDHRRPGALSDPLLRRASIALLVDDDDEARSSDRVRSDGPRAPYRHLDLKIRVQRGRVRESLEMTMQRFLNGLKYDVKGIVRHYSYTNMNQLLHHAREAESQLAEEAKVKGRATGAGRFTPRAPSTAPAPSTRSAPYSTPPSKPVSNVSNTKKSESAASTSGSSMSTARNRDMVCHTCGGKGHFKRDCPNRKVMIINEDNEYETGDDVDPNAPDDDDYDTDGEDAYPSDARTIVVSQRALNVLPSASTQRCNLFQTKALVGPDKACKVIIDGGSCRNLASKELCTKLKLKYLPHPHHTIFSG
ncbi:hypothetical protein QYE76_010900 [Lolium multiflorum]|uniref:CCHC-type domain-containing protein n=1 Tax=Lolium multiflorum TaxID=4521 RepID=A0AAD8X2B7_LOLMU|nr:hypothetical protein QYE76_010900 [Lolium multiflorum]